jgi:hypothetical protein
MWPDIWYVASGNAGVNVNVNAVSTQPSSRR